MVYAATLPGIHNHKAGNVIPGDRCCIHNAQGRHVEPCHQFLQTALLRTGKEQHMGRVQKACGEHASKCIKICIGVAGDKGHAPGILLNG